MSYSNAYDIEAKSIEDIEEYYLSVITRYLGADPKGLNGIQSWKSQIKNFLIQEQSV